MSMHTPNELAEAFPEDAAALRRLKQESARFARLAAQHHSVNRAIHRIECEAEPASDIRLAALRRERLNLLDQIAVMLEDAPVG